MSFPGTFSNRNFRSAAAAAMFFLTPALAQAGSGPFADFAGEWSGTGSITIADSGTERIRCRGTYSVNGDGNTLQQNLRCASDSYKFELTSNVAARGNNLTGSWSEVTRNVNGSIEGSISGGQVNALVTANGYAATFFMSARGSRQSVKIDSKGEIRGVSISLAKGN